jgi:hypothetical protein
MSAAARRIWREIVAGKPVDWFDAASSQLLRLHCEAVAGAHRAAAELRELAPGSAEFTRACVVWKMFSGSAITSAKALRLTTQNTVERHAAKAGERSNVTVLDTRLLGGRD